MKTLRKLHVLPVLLGMVGLPLLVVIGVILWYQSLLTPIATTGNKNAFEISRGESAASIAQRLKGAKLIKSTLAFRMYAKSQGLATHISEGVFYLSPAMSVPEIAHNLTGSGDVDIQITFIEGWRTEQYAELLADKMGIDKPAFLAQAQEGQMFPDTYRFNKKAVPSDIAGLLMQTFSNRVTDAMHTKIKQQKLTFDQGIILASIVEREAHDSVPNERQMIASILVKRLRQGMALQADATVQYALGYDQYQKKWWRELAIDDLKKPSSYNTYLHPGLPPGPICNPGLKSIQAVADASDTSYLFYIHGKDGTVHFAKTLAEQTLNQQKYQ